MSGISGWYDSYEKRFVGEQSVTRTFGEKRYTVVYSGELYNCGDLRRELEKRGQRFETTEIGYARVSTKEQHLDMQLEALKAAGCEKIFSEKMTGRQQNRPELDACLSFLREGVLTALWQ